IGFHRTTNAFRLAQLEKRQGKVLLQQRFTAAECNAPFLLIVALVFEDHREYLLRRHALSNQLQCLNWACLHAFSASDTVHTPYRMLAIFDLMASFRTERYAAPTTNALCVIVSEQRFLRDALWIMAPLAVD